MEPIKVKEHVNIASSLYQYISNEPIVLSPHMEITEDSKQKEIDNLKDFTTQQNDVIRKLIEKQDVLENTIKGQNSLLEEIIKRLKK